MGLTMPQVLKGCLVDKAEQHHPEVVKGQPSKQRRGAQGTSVPEEVEGKGQVSSMDDVIFQSA